jgi:peptide/nickel transport system substrate-binding protein
MRFLLVVLVFSSCGIRREKKDLVIVAVKADAGQINPITHVTAFERILCSGILPRLLESMWDTTGLIRYEPLLAKSYEWSSDGKALTYHLHSGRVWEDGRTITAYDIQSTFRLIADSTVASTKKEHLLVFDMTRGIDHAVEALDDSTAVFHFRHAYPLSVYDTNLQPGFLPHHLTREIRPSELRKAALNSRPLSGGPYRLASWQKQEQIVLERNPDYKPAAGFQSIVFRVIPEYTTRLTSFQTGEVDVMYPINPQDVDRLLHSVKNSRVELVRYRYYDYVGWQNIDAEAYHASKIIRPHPLFGSPIVRRALTMAINRQEIVDGYFYGRYGEVAVSPISPMFRWALNDTLKPWPFDLDQSRTLLREEGWADHDGDGLLDKDGRRFEFDLYYDAGNERRAFSAAVIERGLAAIGIRANIRTAETNVFYDNELNKKYDAFISGIGVPLQIDPTSEWHSDLDRYPYNDISYRNPEVDRLLDEGKKVNDVRDAAPLWRRFQKILHEEQPVTFLYWRHEIVAYQGWIRNTYTSPLGEIDKFWMWTGGE